ncbi:hypothetical protein TNCT_466081 [Trichonephila clavata]|uniref:Uncharacterized protein n=1 Tax=Trichonephila clavata TaxID=2740835 RepID=A0A8X6LKY3_TRICU|nr:hypothetical protein TNCT_466081 [Trichonephila clavata]
MISMSSKNDMCSDNKFQNRSTFNATGNKSNVRVYVSLIVDYIIIHQKECYHKNKDLKCFRCNQFGHKSSQYVFNKPDAKNEVVNEVVHEVVIEINSSTEMSKTVKINALINKGTTITLVRESVYHTLGRPTLSPTRIRLNSFGKNEIKLFGSFKSTVDIGYSKFKTEIYVIDNLQTTIDVIIGTDILKQTEFKISANAIELLPKKDHFINLINVSKAHNQTELKDNALIVLQLKLKKCRR